MAGKFEYHQLVQDRSCQQCLFILIEISSSQKFAENEDFTVNGPFVLLAPSISSNPWPQGFGSSHERLLDIARSFVSMRWSYHVFQDSHGTHCGFASPKRWASYIKPKWFQFTLRQVIHWFTVSSFTSLNPLKLFLESAFGRFLFLQVPKSNYLVEHLQRFHYIGRQIELLSCPWTNTIQQLIVLSITVAWNWGW